MRIVPGLAVTLAGLLLVACGGEAPATLPVTDDLPATPTAEGATLPADWPTDVPTPDGLQLVNATKLDSPQGPTWSATWQGPGDAGQINQTLTDQLKANGFAEEGSFGGDSGDGGISSWTADGVRVQVTVLIENGQVGVNVTALDSQG